MQVKCRSNQAPHRLAVDGRLLTIEEMTAADAAAIAAGRPRHRAHGERRRGGGPSDRGPLRARPALVLCWSRQQRRRRLRGRAAAQGTRLAGPGRPARDAGAPARGRGPGGERLADDVLALDPKLLEGARLVVDGLFGSGLARPLDGIARETVETVARAGVPVVAIDIPSGVHGDSGAVLGAAAPAVLTVTFHRAKPGHLLLPGRDHVGALVVADIGIPADAMTPAGRLFANHPRLWRQLLPRRTAASHKYTHGHALVLGGGIASSGAARMAARAALRAGAGLVSVVCPKDALPVYAAQLSAVMVAPFADDQEFAHILADPRRNAMLLGPGAGVGRGVAPPRAARARGAQGLCPRCPDALTSVQTSSSAVPGDPRPRAPTPHEGEFKRGVRYQGDRATRPLAAAAQAGAVMLLKGGDTVIAARRRARRRLQPAAPAALATAGSGRRPGRHRARPPGSGGHAGIPGRRRCGLAARQGRGTWPGLVLSLRSARDAAGRFGLVRPFPLDRAVR